MFENSKIITIKEVRSNYSIFFKKVLSLYNKAFFKKEKSSKVKDVERYANELFSENYITEHLHLVILESIQKFALLLPSNKGSANLILLNTWVELSIKDFNLEIE